MARRGRNKHLISLRDEKLIRRYYYWTEVERLRFDDALKVLSEQEFFISEDRIMSIIRENADKVPDIPVKPVPRVKKPKVTREQLSLFSNE
ncbi:MAG TPA: transposase [Porphyromonadaceae bacterium]|nr:transposase [Porphyromonadaceae bacterium]